MLARGYRCRRLKVRTPRASSRQMRARECAGRWAVPKCAAGLVAPDAGAVVRGLLGDAEMGADVGPGGAGAVRARHRLLLRHAVLHRLGHVGDQLALARLARGGAPAVLPGAL